MIAATTILLLYYTPKDGQQREWHHLTVEACKNVTMSELTTPIIYQLTLLAVHLDNHHEFQLSVNRKDEITLMAGDGKELTGYRTSINAVLAQSSKPGVSKVSSLFANYATVYSKLIHCPSITVETFLKKNIKTGKGNGKPARSMKIVNSGPLS